MISNLSIWLAIAAVVLVTLYYKGYVKLPSAARSGATESSAQKLGVAYHKALYAEAQAEMFEEMAKSRADLIKERLTAPFSTPESAGPTTAGVPQP